MEASTSWDEDGGTDEPFSVQFSVAGMILDNKFARYLGNERADKRIEEILETQNPEADSRILVLPEFIPCQKRLSETDYRFSLFFHPTAVVTVSSLRKKNIP